MDELKLANLRPMVLQDLDMVRAWRNHTAIRSFMLESRIITAEEHLSWFMSSVKDENKELFVYEHEDFPVGFVQVKHEYRAALAEWGFYAAPDAPKGVGTWMLQTALHHLFSSRNVFKVHAKVLEFNKASIRLHEKLGFNLEGILKQHHVDGAKRLDVHCYGLMKSECKIRNT